MRYWEYKFVEMELSNGPTIEETLTRLGHEGWEAFGFSHIENPAYYDILRYTLKRELIEVRIN